MQLDTIFLSIKLHNVCNPPKDKKDIFFKKGGKGKYYMKKKTLIKKQTTL